MSRKSAPPFARFAVVLLAGALSLSVAAAPPRFSQSEPATWWKLVRWFLASFEPSAPESDWEHRELAAGLMGDPNGRAPDPPPPSATTQGPERGVDSLE
jgi:hypothetical protein